MSVKQTAVYAFRRKGEPGFAPKIIVRECVKCSRIHAYHSIALIDRSPGAMDRWLKERFKW